MKWFYNWRYYRHQAKSIKYTDARLYPTLFKYHIEKMRYYAVKLGWKF